MENIELTGRQRFNETWLFEMPYGIGSFQNFDGIVFNITDLLDNRQIPENLGNNLNRIQLNNTAYFWMERDNVIQLGVELQKHPEGWSVAMTGKNPRLKRKPPFASDLYCEILKYLKSSIRLLSDTQLSDEGFDIWKRLLKDGNTISIYDKNLPGKTFKTIHTEEELENYFSKTDLNCKDYQYILTETSYLAEMRSNFNTRRYRELSGLLME
jgi:hypothetical protein